MGSDNDATILLETDGKSIYLWVNSQLVSERPAKNTYILGKPFDEAKLVQKVLATMGYKTTMEVSDHVNLMTWDLEERRWVDVPWKNMLGNPAKGK